MFIQFLNKLSWKTNGKDMGKSWKSHEQVTEMSWISYGKVMEKINNLCAAVAGVLVLLLLVVGW